MLVVSWSLALALVAQGVSPSPDGNYPGFNTAEGQDALFSLTTGLWNTAIGGDALFSDTTGTGNTALGLNVLRHNISGNGNTATGVDALFANTNGATNCGFGVLALFNNTSGSENSAFGWGAMVSNTTGNNNTATGVQALFHNATGGGNTAVGYSAGFNLTGDNNINIGYFVEGVAGESNTIRIGTNLPAVDGGSACYIGGIWTQGCDPDTCYYVGVDADGKMGTHPAAARFMRDVLPMGRDSDSILALKPVTFHYNTDAKNTPCFGLIAEDVAKVNPALVVRDKNGGVFTVRYDQVNAMLLNEFLKEHEKVQQLEASLAAQRKDFNAAITELKKETDIKIQKVTGQLELDRRASRMVLKD